MPGTVRNSPQVSLLRTWGWNMSFLSLSWFMTRKFTVTGAHAFVLNLVRASIEVSTGQPCFLGQMSFAHTLTRADGTGTGIAEMRIDNLAGSATLLEHEDTAGIRWSMAGFYIQNIQNDGWSFHKPFPGHTKAYLYITRDAAKFRRYNFSLSIPSASTLPRIRSASHDSHKGGLGGEWVGTSADDRRFETYQSPVPAELDMGDF